MDERADREVIHLRADAVLVGKGNDGGEELPTTRVFDSARVFPFVVAQPSFSKATLNLSAEAEHTPVMVSPSNVRRKEVRLCPLPARDGRSEVPTLGRGETLVRPGSPNKAP